MKNLFLILLFLLPLTVLSQKLTQYKASNGKTYHVGDTVKIALGSMPDGDFKYVQVSPLLPMPPRRNNSSNLNAHKDFSNTNAVIRKIKTVDQQNTGTPKVILNVKAIGLMSYDVWIEEAIAVCEVTPCASSKTTAAPASVADELLKLKKLLDAGAITQSEYNAQKKKLLTE